MLDSVAVVVPWRSSRERAAIWNYVRPRHHYPVVLAPGPDPWCKGEALAPALAALEAEIAVVCDADVVCDGIPAAVEAVCAGAPWAIPHRFVKRLDAESTNSLLHGRAEPLTWGRPYVGVEGGGIVVAPRETLTAVPMDCRFKGWGQEDECWALALRTLLGAPWRGTADLIHLWHPPERRWTRRRGSVASWELRQRYFRANGDPDAIRALLEEARCSTNY